MKGHRQYVNEQKKKDSRLARDLEDAKVQVRLAVLIANLRESRGLSQRDLAKKTGFKQPQIARIESGEYLPTVDTLLTLADSLGARVIIGPRQKIEIKAA